MPDQPTRDSVAADATLTRRTVGAAAWAATGAWGQAVLRFAVIIVLSRLLGPDEFGTMAVALSFSQLALVLTDLGIGQALIQRRELDDRYIGTAWVASVVFGLLMGSVLWFAAPTVAQYYKSEVLVGILRALAFTFPIRALGIAAESLLQRGLRFRSLAKIDWISYGFGYGAMTIVCALLGMGVWALVVGVLGQTLIRVASAVVMARDGLRVSFSLGALREMVVVGGGFALGRIANYVATSGDNLVVGRTLGAGPLGIYSRAYQLLMMPVDLIGGVVDRVLFPAMSQVQDEPNRLGAAYRKATAVLALAMLPVSVASFILTSELIHVLLGPRWTDVVVPFQIFCVIMTVRTTYKVSVSVTRAAGAVYRHAFREIVYAMAVVVGAVVGSAYGAFGVAVGVGLAVLLNGFLTARIALAITRQSWGNYLHAHIGGVRLAFIVGIGVQLVASLLRGAGMPSIVVLVAGGLSAALLVILTCRSAAGVLGSEGQWALRHLLELAAPGVAAPVRRFLRVG